MHFDFGHIANSCPEQTIQISRPDSNFLPRGKNWYNFVGIGTKIKIPSEIKPPLWIVGRDRSKTKRPQQPGVNSLFSKPSQFINFLWVLLTKPPKSRTMGSFLRAFLFSVSQSPDIVRRPYIFLILLCNVKTKGEILLKFCGLLRISELNWSTIH